MAPEELLPAEILLKVVEDHLPITAQCRFRSVCKAWKNPSVRRGAFAGWYVCRFLYFGACGLINLFNGENWHTVHQMPAVSCMEIYGCVNGLLLCFLGSDFGKVRLSVFDIFQGQWTELPVPPPSPKKQVMFVGMEHINRPYPCSGSIDNYIFVVLMGLRSRKRGLVTNLELQVYNRGTWSLRSLHIPDNHYIMYLTTGLREGCFALKGSVLYFLAELLDFSAFKLCCADVLSPGADVKVVCRLCPAISRESALLYTKLAVCSGKLMLVSQISETEVIEVYSLDEEKSEWRYVSRLPPEAVNEKFELRYVHGNEHELVFYTGLRFGQRYNALSNTWSAFDLPSNLCMTIIPVVTKPLK